MRSDAPKQTRGKNTSTAKDMQHYNARLNTREKDGRSQEVEEEKIHGTPGSRKVLACTRNPPMPLFWNSSTAT